MFCLPRIPNTPNHTSTQHSAPPPSQSSLAWVAAHLWRSQSPQEKPSPGQEETGETECMQGGGPRRARAKRAAALLGSLLTLASASGFPVSGPQRSPSHHALSSPVQAQLLRTVGRKLRHSSSRPQGDRRQGCAHQRTYTSQAVREQGRKGSYTAHRALTGKPSPFQRRKLRYTGAW